MNMESNGVDEENILITLAIILPDFFAKIG